LNRTSAGVRVSGVSSRTLAIATSVEHGAHDADARPLVAALGQLGVEATLVAWDDPEVDWDAFALVVVRSTWDYVERRPAFVRWASGVPRLANPAPVLSWNTDKVYLRQLAAAGVPVVPTTFLGPGDELEDPGGPFVVKPSVSAGSMDTARYDVAELPAARRHVAAITTGGRTAMIQPYLAAVDEVGESTLVFFDGRFSHSVRRGAMLFPGGRRQPEDQAVAPWRAGPRERAAAEAVLAAVPRALQGPEPLLYARVDLLADADGSPLLLELEVTEPFLFLGSDPSAPARFARAMAARLR
jgi:hypothetical protein